MKKLLLTAVISVLSLNAAHAYQVELNGGLSFDGHPSNTNDTLGVDGSATYYFNAVQGKTGPLAEAAFIERASSVTAGYGYFHNDTVDAKAHAFGLGGEVYVPNTNFYAAAAVGTVKPEGVEHPGGIYSAEIGYLPITNLLLTVGAAGEIDTLSDEKVYPTVSAKYLTKVGDNDVNLEGDAIFTDNGDTYTVSGDYYVDRKLSLGGSLSTTTDQNDDNVTIGLNARQFIADNISFQGGLAVGLTNEHSNFGLNVGGTYRF